jgi:hypothetical protein
MPKFNLEVIPSSEIVDRFIKEDNQVEFYDDWCGHWVMTDTRHALVDSVEFYEALQTFIIWIDSECDVQNLADQYWTMVNPETFVDMVN